MVKKAPETAEAVENTESRLIDKGAKARATWTSLDHTATETLIPTPEAFSKYEKVIPGGAERILEIAEERSKHDIELEKKILATDVRMARTEQILLYLLSIVAFGLGGALLIMGKEVAGLVVILAAVALLAGKIWLKK